MILSPCIDCPKRNQPKDICSKDCALLKAVQELDLLSTECCSVTAIDYSAENRYAVCFDIQRASALL